MERRPGYYAYRHGASPDALALGGLQRLLIALYIEYEDKGWFQWRMGKDCVDAQRDIGAYVLDELGKDLWPFSLSIKGLPEAWLFTVVEFLLFHSAAPTETHMHDYYACGLHVDAADEGRGRTEFRQRVNSLLRRYEPAYELTESGEVWARMPSGLEELAPEATKDASIDRRVASATHTYRRYGATSDDKRHAVHDLADVLEHLRKSIGTQLPSKDESDLFKVANSFGIRHHNQTQQTTYDEDIWLDWMFYSFLNAIQVATRVINRSQP